jgi:F0F1-type ATP synthase delta subunit
MSEVSISNQISSLSELVKKKRKLPENFAEKVLDLELELETLQNASKEESDQDYPSPSNLISPRFEKERLDKLRQLMQLYTVNTS